MKIKTRLLACLILLALGGCVSMQPAKEAAANKTVPWATRQQQLSGIRQWTIRGAFGVRTPKKAVSANLYWRQAARNYTLRLLGPMGGGRLLLQGSKQHVSMTTGDNKKVSAPSAESLLRQQTGWSVPISSLYYWVRGMPVPGIAAQTKFDQYNHITHLKQQGWSVLYQRYTAVKHMDLPSFMILSGPGLKIRIAIKQWRI